MHLLKKAQIHLLKRKRGLARLLKDFGQLSQSAMVVQELVLPLKHQKDPPLQEGLPVFVVPTDQ